MAIFRYKDATPVVGKECYIADSAEVIGNVELGDGCYVGPGAIIRGDYGKIVIGAGTSVEENCVIHARPGETATIGNRVTIGHGAIIHTPKKIEDNCVIGMQAVVSDFSSLGEWTAVGEGAVVRNNQEIPARSIAVGVPAKIIGQISDEYMEQWTHYKQVYVDLARTYREDLKQID